jgi:hypothetical protein
MHIFFEPRALLTIQWAEFFGSPKICERARVPECLSPQIDMILDRATNVLSAIHPHVYFPTYSNGLKEIGRFLGFERADEDATGLHSIVWRRSWDVNHDPDIKARLVQYNQDDCRELRHIADFIRGLTSPDSGTDIGPQTAFKTTRTEELATDRPRWELFRPKEYASEDLKKVAKSAYFDYQREKVFVRTHPHFTIINKRHRKFKQTSLHINKVLSIECQRCPRCRSKHIHKDKQMSHDLVDLKFSKGGVKKWVTRTVAGTPQSATINSAFATGLQATVKDAGNNPVSGVTVTFTAPGSGASGLFGSSG